jgi:hypothetical protein
MSRGRQRAIAVVASLPACCSVCRGAREVQLRAIPEGDWVKACCPHCQPRNGAPIFPLPWRHEQEGGAS